MAANLKAAQIAASAITCPLVHSPFEFLSVSCDVSKGCISITVPELSASRSLITGMTETPESTEAAVGDVSSRLASGEMLQQGHHARTDAGHTRWHHGRAVSAMKVLIRGAVCGNTNRVNISFNGARSLLSTNATANGPPVSNMA